MKHSGLRAPGVTRFRMDGWLGAKDAKRQDPQRPHVRVVRRAEGMRFEYLFEGSGFVDSRVLDMAHTHVSAFFAQSLSHFAC